MKYEKELKQSKDVRSFIQLCLKNKEYRNIKPRTFQRQYYKLRKLIKQNIKSKWEPNGIDYIKVYKHSKDKNDFVKRVLNLSNMKRSSAMRRYYDTKKKVEENKKKTTVEDLYTPPIDIEIQNREKTKLYLDSEKLQPTYSKMLEFNDMKRMYKNKLSKEILMRYGFNILEINWLEDNGDLNGIL